MTNPKPIVVMYLPDHYADSGWKAETVMGILNNLHPPGSDSQYLSTDYWTQYYWFCFYKDEITAPELQVFYAKDFTPINFEELKAFIEENLKQSNVQDTNSNSSY